MEPPPPPRRPKRIFFSLDEKVICSHPVWGLWRELGENGRLATGVSAADKQKGTPGEAATGGKRGRRWPTDTEVYCGWGVTFSHQAEQNTSCIREADFWKRMFRSL